MSRNPESRHLHISKLLGPDHPLTLTVFSNLGMREIEHGQLDKAEPLLSIALIETRNIWAMRHAIPFKL